MTESPASSRDRFLGGALEILQPLTGYRAGTDPVFMAAAVPARAGESVLDLGCGVGVAALCLWHRTKATVTGVEIQPEYARLARINAMAAHADFEIAKADVASLSPQLHARSFDHVMTNPPYFARQSGTAASDAGKELANREFLPLSEWLDVAIRRLVPRGTLTVVARTDRLPEVLQALVPRIGKLSVKPLAARQGRPAKRVIIQGVKGSKTPLKLLSPLVLHAGDRHESDRENHTADVQDILRRGRELLLD